MMMIYSTLLLSLTVLAVPIDGSHVPYLRTTESSKLVVDDDSSNCNSIRDPDHCARTMDTVTGRPCQWCIAGAIPSECMSPTQAALLPPDVFDCATPSTTTTTTIPTVFQFDSVVFGTTQTYSLVHHHHDHHQSHVIDDTAKESMDTTPLQAPPQPSKSDLCDDSSASLSGYMDIKGSEYDASGEDKHLFYWFFEKRDADAEDTDADTPVRMGM